MSYKELDVYYHIIILHEKKKIFFNLGFEIYYKINILYYLYLKIKNNKNIYNFNINIK